MGAAEAGEDLEQQSLCRVLMRLAVSRSRQGRADRRAYVVTSVAGVPTAVAALVAGAVFAVPLPPEQRPKNRSASSATKTAAAGVRGLSVDGEQSRREKT